MNRRQAWGLAAAGVETRPFFPCLHLLPHFAASRAPLPVAESLSARGFNLPSFPDLTEEEAGYVIQTVRQRLRDPQRRAAG